MEMNQPQYGLVEKPYVTVTVPVYNEEDCIEDCITSLLKQDFEPLEILVVDDGSVDNSARICENLKIKVLRGTHKGMGAARNLGARNANGNILVLVDADMLFAPDYVSRLVAPIIRGEAIATCHWNEMVSNWDNPWARCQTWFNGLPARRRHPFAVAEYSGQYRAVRKDFFVDSGGFAEEQGYKADISIYRRTGVSAKIVPDAGCFHRNIKTPRELFKEALWQGRNIAVRKERRLKRCFAAIIYRNPLIAISRGIYLSVGKREPRMVPYSAVHSIGLILGMVHALYSGYYQK